MKAALAQSWNPKGPCKASWRSSKTTQGRSPHTHADAWPPRWLSFLGEPAGRANGLGDWQNKGDQPDVGQMAGQSQGAWLGRSRATAAPRPPPIWASSQKFFDVRKRLKLSQQFVDFAEKARKEAEAAPSPKIPAHLGWEARWRLQP